MGYSPWGHKQSDMIKHSSTRFLSFLRYNEIANMTELKLKSYQSLSKLIKAP